MTPLRRQIEQARERHLAARYPGDLAADVLGEHARRSRWRIFAAAGVATAAAVAACIAVVVFLHRPSPTPGPGAVAQEVNFVVPGKPDMPEGLPVVPSYQQLTTVPAKPEFPSIFASL